MYGTLDLCSPGSESESDRRHGLLHENPGKFRLCDLLDISGTLTEAAGAAVDKRLLHLFCGFFVASWTGVIKYRGPRPSNRPGQDREIVAKRNPLLIFPEGTCVNNQHSVILKKVAFEIGCTVSPIVIKYNKIFSDAFWDSRKHSFTVHLFRLMASWALVCDVYFLEPQKPKPGETPIEFAERVRDMICARAVLKKVDWDGFLKHSRPSPKLLESKQRRFAESLLQRMSDN